MSKIVIIGNSAAGFSCCEALVKSNSGHEISIISQSSAPAHKRNLLIEYLAGEIKESELFLSQENFYSQNNINLIKDSKVSRVDAKKQAVILKDNTRIDYDYLVIASGRKVSIADIPGKTKDGVFALYDFEDAKKIKTRLILADTVCIVGDPKISQQLCEAIAPSNKEIKIISRPKPDSCIPSDKIEWIDNFDLVEIIGEGAELKALKLSNGKAIGTALVLFVGNYTPSTEFLKETSIKTSQGYVTVDSQMQTNFENVFSCGSACKNESNPDREKSWDEAVSEGILVASNILQSLERGKILCQQKS